MERGICHTANSAMNELGSYNYGQIIIIIIIKAICNVQDPLKKAANALHMHETATFPLPV